MNITCFIGLIGLFLSINVHAFTCYLTIAKDSCWINYNLTVSAYDSLTNKKLVSVLIPTGKSWEREKFSCKEGTTLRFQAQFTPIFWQDDEEKIFYGSKFFALPREVSKTDTAWNITQCYPEQFSEVPMPPEADNKCACNLDKIPAITSK